MSDFLKLVGEQIRRIRKSKQGLTQAQLAEKIGENMSKSRISDIELGKINISLKTLEEIMNALDISPNELFQFGELNNVPEIGEKKLLVEIHKSVLMERELDDIKYVVRTTKDYLNTVDSKTRKRD